MDPAGAAFGVWQARAFPGAQIVNEPGAMCWNEQVSRDFEGSKAFYAAVFGYEYADMSGDGFSYATFKVDGRDVGGIGDLHAGVPAGTPAGWRVYFGAADTDASLARVQANGGSVTREPIDHPYGRMARSPTTRALSSRYSALRPGKTTRADGWPGLVPGRSSRLDRTAAVGNHSRAPGTASDLGASRSAPTMR